MSRCRPSPLDALVAAAPYSNAPMRSLLHVYKYEGVQEAREAVMGFFGGFAAGLLPLLDSWDAEAIVPVPMHFWREAGRGFNQASEMAQGLSGLTGLPVVADLLVRKWRIRRQAELDSGGRARFRNAAGSFALRSGTRVPRSVILVDDVCTTGATLSEAAARLRAGGAASVQAVVLLRG